MEDDPLPNLAGLDLCGAVWLSPISLGGLGTGSDAEEI
jgi:hypothetical protein